MTSAVATRLSSGTAIQQAQADDPARRIVVATAQATSPG
jgi:hypothetical protein